MSMSLALFYRHVISQPLDRLRRCVRDGSPRVVPVRKSTPPSAAHQGPYPRRHDAESLERIAAYACAGYFTTGYTLEVFHVSD